MFESNNYLELENELDDEDEDDDEDEGNVGSPTCGRGRSIDRIVGGQVAPPESFPWAASIQLSYGFHFCGASIIHPQVLMD